MAQMTLIKKVDSTSNIILLQRQDGSILTDFASKFSVQSCIKFGTLNGLLKAGIKFDPETQLILADQIITVYVSQTPDGRTIAQPDWRTYKIGSKWESPPESQTQENKASVSGWNSGKISLIGMYNTQGGRLTLGLGDDGRILGIDDEIRRRGGKDALENYLRTSFKQATEGYLLYSKLSVSFEEVNGRTLCHLDIPAGKSEPAMLHNFLPIRVGAQTNKLTGRDIIRWTIERTKQMLNN